MAQVDTVVPNSLNYTDIKPQAIENKIQLCRYQPTSSITGVKGGEMVKFLISGNGFLDPYSTYFQFKVKVPNLSENEIRTLDRSAHSFISRIVIRSQGVELERIEHYDVMAALINDMIYSPEQCTQHYWEGFPTHTSDISMGTDHIARYVTATGKLADEKQPACVSDRDQLLRWLSQGASPTTHAYIGETAFHQLAPFANGQQGGLGANLPCDFAYFPDFTHYTELAAGVPNIWAAEAVLPASATMDPYLIGVNPRNTLVPVTFACHKNGRRIPSGLPVAGDSDEIRTTGTTEMQFIIPVYSGILGLLMPEKKLLPINLLPLDIEIVFNKHALYSSKTDANGGSREYAISEFFLYGNTIFFEQEIHRTLEASVADHGLFIYCNSFHSAPQQLIATNQIPSTMFISMNLKSINSVHWAFLYSHFETKACARKLHFVSHNINKMQLLNGTTYIPQLAVEGDMGSSDKGQQNAFVIELYKAWNRMHDPARDGALHAYNMCGDEYAGQFDPIYQGGAKGMAGGIPWTAKFAPVEGIEIGFSRDVRQTALQILNKQANVGRCQYGISLEGEELGADRTMITGRKSQYPFQLLLSSGNKFTDHTSYMLTYLRADFIVYIRPDLQIVTLGK